MNLRAKLIVIISVAAIFFNFSEVFGIERFPPPDFEPGTYTMPTPTKPPARAYYWEFIDMFLLVAVLSLASYFALRLRSRRHLFWLTLFSIFYFGFIRQGCVCPIGSIQNVTLALFNNNYAVPVSVMFFFLMPLVFTLFFGRTFCAAVCPLGAIQDIVVWKPIKIKPWIENALRIIPFVYLGLAVLFAATGSAFLICEYDPFISF
ncbi:MAG: 4Fe-4S binding protein, partial [Limisphaerales bacterium]